MSSVVYGRNAVLELIRTRPEEVEKIYFQFNTEQSKLKEILVTAKRHNISIGKARNNRLVELSGTDKHQGVCALVGKVKYFELDEILARPRNSKQLIVILDGLEDPHNVGAIIRTAEAAAVDAVIIPHDSGCPINATVAKTSAGALSHIRLCKVVNLSQTIERLKKHGFWVYGLDMDGEKNYYEIDFNDHCAIVVGSEGKGIRQLVRKNCDALIRLPIAGNVESLNASVSAAIPLYEAMRQRLS
ncbi:RNA methyltransferase, TrmH family, group 3 [Chloroherpeton thalassium ATCC 35110]|uniref:RNA methyltransferase, TrmH family, group 3 n=1 Tax=Chloroherpeton thalassium (strain ATCC 35110 / GB-78) TaxID=517418 RepID=B3QWL0_CHLT3|nr:23S rRNA (guanosine(2251)-2'-O)-methyltransferase RlmB [Chloroherpeton thalassium]ACF14770.1 RNA methyltransferase, TrmH family, group 3 [Chloroherpeton thalassium ATCC 35110]